MDKFYVRGLFKSQGHLALRPFCISFKCNEVSFSISKRHKVLLFLNISWIVKRCNSGGFSPGTIWEWGLHWKARLCCCYNPCLSNTLTLQLAFRIKFGFTLSFVYQPLANRGAEWSPKLLLQLCSISLLNALPPANAVCHLSDTSLFLRLSAFLHIYDQCKVEGSEFS